MPDADDRACHEAEVNQHISFGDKAIDVVINIGLNPWGQPERSGSRERARERESEKEETCRVVVAAEKTSPEERRK